MLEMARGLRRSVATLTIVGSLALAFVPSAFPIHYFTGNIIYQNVCDNIHWRVCSGWNYWFATEAVKDYGLENVGFENDTTVKWVSSSSTDIYTDINILGMGGYIKAFTRNVVQDILHNDIWVCVC
jgi:hypothetical protein